MIVVFSTEYLPDPSHSLTISRIIKTGDRLKIFVKETVRSGPNCMPVPDILVYPLHVVEADLVEKKIHKNAELQLERESVDCGPPQ